MISNLIKHASHYASGTILLSIASLISFPILTRLLSMEEYGVLSLLTTLLGLFVALNKMGLQQSVLRYYDSNSPGLKKSLLVTVIASICFMTFVINIGFLIFPYDLISEYFYVLLLSAALQAFKSILINCYTAEHRSLWVTIFNVAYKYLALTSMLLCIFFIDDNALSVIYSILFTDIVFSVLISYFWVLGINWDLLDKPAIKKIVIYGLPFMLVEFIQIGHAFVDRFIIELYLGPNQVAAYVAPYSMADIISNVIFGAIATALVPIYMSLWKEGKKNETEYFLSTVSDYFLLIFPIIITGSYFISEPIMILLATEKYAQSAHILPISLTGIAIFASTFIYSAGLRLKKTKMNIVMFVFESLVINIVLNVLFIEKYGITASAWSTVISYLWMTFRYYRASSKTLKITFDFFPFIKGVGVSLLMYFILGLFKYESGPVIELLVIIVSGVFISLIFLYFIDKKIRSLINMVLLKVKNSC